MFGSVVSDLFAGAFEGFSSALSQILTGSSWQFSRMVPSDALGLLVEASGFQSFARRDFFGNLKLQLALASSPAVP